MSLDIIVPVLDRPHRVQPLLDSIRRATPEANVTFVLSPGDDRELAAIEAAEPLAGMGWTFHPGNYAAKINHGVRASGAELIFLGADDLLFYTGWLKKAAPLLEKGAQVVGVNDLIPRNRIHATHFLVTREYARLGSIDDPNQLLHEGYDHSCVDDELIATATHRGVYVYAPDVVVEHLHPDVGKAPNDDVYRKGRQHLRADRRLFRKREQLWR